MTSQAAKDLLAAVEYMKEHGRTRIVLQDAMGRVCPLGAIAHVVLAYPSDSDLGHSDLGAYRLIEHNARAMRAVRKLAKRIDPINARGARAWDACRIVYRYNDGARAWDASVDAYAAYAHAGRTDEEVFATIESAAK